MGWIKISKANLYVKSIDLPVWEGEYFWENEWFVKQNQWGSFRSVCSNIVLGPTLLSLISWFMVLRLQKESREGERVWSERSLFFLYLSEYNNKTWGKKQEFSMLLSHLKNNLWGSKTLRTLLRQWIYIAKTPEWMRRPLKLCLSIQLLTLLIHSTKKKKHCLH